MNESSGSSERPEQVQAREAARRREAWAGELGAMAGDAIVLAYYAWWLIGWEKYYSTPELRIPRSVEFIWLLAMGAAGLMAGQVVRQMRRVGIGYPVAMGQEEKKG